MVNDKEVKFDMDLFGQTFPLKTTDGNIDDLKKVASYYKRVVLELMKKFPNVPHLNISILAGIMITDDLYNLSKSRNSNFSFDEKRCDEMISEALKQLELSLNL
jgi:cell division protein ZapA (FtsZ GTPase activity inhibitor)